MKIVSKIALAATFGLALTTLSCSDDDKSGGWLTCEEYYSTIEKCDNEIQCVLDAACNGTNKSSECKAHYEDQGCKEEEND